MVIMNNKRVDYEEIERILSERTFNLGDENIKFREANLKNYTNAIEGKNLTREEKIKIQIEKGVPREDLNGVNCYMNTSENIQYIISDLKAGLKVYLYSEDSDGEALEYLIYTTNDSFKYRGELIDYYECDVIIDGYSNEELFDRITMGLDLGNKNIRSFCNEWYLIANDSNNFDKYIDKLIEKYNSGQFEVNNIDIKSIKSVEYIDL
jgi:hypothetical protein